MTILSLHPVKHLTTAEGGAVPTDDDDLAARLRPFRNHGITSTPGERRDWKYEMVDLGYNYRLTDIHSVLGSRSSDGSMSSSNGGGNSPPGTSSGSAGPSSSMPVDEAGATPPGTSRSSGCGWSGSA